MKAAIWSLGTLSDGLYVVAVVPFVRPEKNASAIWQKKVLPITSVNGKVVDTPPHIPVSADSRVDVTTRTKLANAKTSNERSFLFICLLVEPRL